MPRERTFSYPYTLKFKQLDRALVEYYARRFATDKSRVLRAILREFARNDVNFDSQGFRDFVDAELLRPAEDDPELQNEIQRSVEEFLEPSSEDESKHKHKQKQKK